MILPQIVAAQGRNQTVAKQGDSANGNGVFDNFNNYRFSNTGQSVFRAWSIDGTNGGTSDDDGIYFHDGTGLTEIAREGAATPSRNGNYGGFFDVWMNDSGQIVFESFSITNSTNGSAEGLFLYDGSSVSEIVRQGEAAAGGNGNYGLFQDTQFNEAGQTAFRSYSMTNTSNPSADREGLFFHNGSFISQIARGGSSAGGNGTLSQFPDLVLNDSGNIAFEATMTGTNNGALDDSGIYFYNGSSVSELVREGDSAAGNGTFGSMVFSSMRLNNSNQVAFLGSNILGTTNGAADNGGLFMHDGAGLNELVREGDSAAGNGKMGSFSQIELNELGQVIFRGTNLTETNNGTLNNEGIFLADGSGVIEIAREGDSAAGNGTFGGFSSIDLNDGGQMVFSSFSMKGTDNGFADDYGAFISDGTEIIELRREGDVINGQAVSSVGDLLVNEFGQVGALYFNATGGYIIENWTPDVNWRSTSSGNWDDKSNWTLSIDPALVHDTFLNSDASLTVAGPTTDRTVRSLQIGGGVGQVTLDLQNGASITALNNTMINAKGTLTGDGQIFGSVINNGGRIAADNLTLHGSVSNRSGGVIDGNGLITAGAVDNQVSGRIQANNGNHLRINAPITNSGVIEVIGGQFETNGMLQNNSSTGLITARNATIRAYGGINNDGSIGFSFGTSDVFGDITNNSSGIINLSGGSNVTFYDDIDQNGTMIVAATGNTASTAVIFGEFSGTGGFSGGGDVYALGDLRPGASPASVIMDGNLFLGASTLTEFEFAGDEIGEFDQLLVSGDLGLAGSLSVSLLDDFNFDFNQEFLIAEVDGDLLGQFIGLNDGDLVGNFGGMDLFITYSAGNGNDIALFTSVPEPSSMLFLATGLTLVMLRRRRRYQAT